MMQDILWAIIGGGLIGLAASWLLISKGRIAGISGILGGLLGTWNLDSSWRFSFVFGLFVGGGILMLTVPEAIVAPHGRSLLMLGVAGVLVGYGTRLGNGCTSGHGICGLTRFSKRSFVATLTFMGTGFLVATVLGKLGGAL
jgi:hypothetical protein